MSIAIIAHKKAANTNGGILGVTPATFYATPLTDMLVNDGAVQNFRAAGAGVGPSQFDLSPGSYRVSADINIVAFIALSPATFIASTIGLYNVTAGRFEYHKTSTTPVISCCPIVGGGGGPGPAISVGDEMASTISLQCEFSVTGAINTYEIRQTMGYNSGSSVPLAYMSETDTMGESALVTAGDYSEYYNFVKINRLST